MRTHLGLTLQLATLVAIAAAPATAGAQAHAPTSAGGQALVDSELPGGTVVVRLGLRTLSTPAVNVPVTLTVGGATDRRTERTDAQGRATFRDLPAGSRVQASATVGNETKSTSEVEVSASAGLRTMLLFGITGSTRPAGAALPPGHPPLAAAPADDAGDGRMDSFDAGVPVGTARADQAVPRGSIMVSVKTPSTAAVGDREVSLIEIRDKGGLSVRKTVTGSDGKAQFAASQSADVTGYAVAIEHQGVRLSTRPFTMPDDRGISVELITLEVTSDPSVVSIGSGGRVVVQIREDVLQVMEVFPLEARTGTLFVPRDKGLFIPLPTGFSGAQALDGTRLEVMENRGVVLQGPIPPAGSRGPGGEATHVSVGFFIKTNQASAVTLRQPMPNGLGVFALIVEKMPGLSVEAEGDAAATEEREAGGRRFTLRPVEGLPPGNELVFTIAGLPTPDQVPSWIAGGLALAMALGAVIAARRPRSVQGGPDHRKELERRRDELIGELVALERGSRDGGDEARRGAKREKLIARLQPLYRELIALEDRRVT